MEAIPIPIAALSCFCCLTRGGSSTLILTLLYSYFILFYFIFSFSCCLFCIVLAFGEWNTYYLLDNIIMIQMLACATD
ncbi:hypothetical protein HOY80DRAFT_283717 [Tuber brumale]|nr:hypothetical protein HOY80DRAFT_283717 [Tuber brumale]